MEKYIFDEGNGLWYELQRDKQYSGVCGGNRGHRNYLRMRPQIGGCPGECPPDLFGTAGKNFLHFRVCYAILLSS